MSRIFKQLFLALLMFSLTGELLADDPADILARARLLKGGGVILEAESEYEKYIKLRPNNIRARAELIGLLLDINRLTKALPHIDMLVKNAPDDPQVKKYQIIAQDHRDKLEDERLNLMKSLSSDANSSPSTIIKYARKLSANKMHPQAAKEYVRYLELKPNDVKARMELATMCSWEKDYKVCRFHLNKIIKVSPKYSPAWLLLGDINMWEGFEDAALESYQRVLKYNPSHKLAMVKLRKITTQPGFQENRLKEALERNPKGTALISLAKIYFEKGRVWEADSLINIRLEVAPKDEKALNLREAIEESHREERRKLFEKFNHMLVVNPADSVSLLAVAEFYASQKEFEKSIEIYDRYLKIYTTDYIVRLFRANVVRWAGHTEEAIEEYRIIAFVLPFNRDANLGLADALMDVEENLAEAATIYKTDLDENPDSKRSRLGYAEALRRQGQYDLALEMFENVLIDYPENREAIQGVKLLNKDMSPLLQSLEKKLKKNPDDETLRRRLAGIYYDAARYFEAEAHALVILENNPDDEMVKSLLTRIDAKKEMFLQAELKKAEVVVQEDPLNEESRLRYARLLTARGHTDRAIAQYRIILKVRPGDHEILVIIARMYSDKERFNESAEIYRQLADDNPDVFEYRYKYGQTLSWAGDHDAAQHEYKRALRLKPESVETRLAIANIYRWKGDIYSAHDDFSDILAIDPGNSNARIALKDMAGPLFRGVEFAHFDESDSEDFLHTESKISSTATFTLRLKSQVGFGSVYLRQYDNKKQYTPYSRGDVIFVTMNYSFDPLTSMQADYKHFIFPSRQTDAIDIVLRRDFKDIPELEGLKGVFSYSSQDAIYVVASSTGLRTWVDQITADRVIIDLTYDSTFRMIFKGKLTYIFLSDGNNRTDTFAKAGYMLNENLRLGLKMETVKAKLQNTSYWTPESYGTVAVWAELENKFKRIDYKLYGAIGRVQKTGDTIREFSVQGQYNLRNRFSLGGAYSSLVSSRSDGEYRYWAWRISLFWRM